MKLENLTLDFLKKNCKLIHSFGLGFIQIKLNEKERVHIYTPKVRLTTKPEEVHDHRYDFKSVVLKGNLINSVYELISGDSHLLRKENCSANKENHINNAKECGIRLICSTNMSRGSEYFMEKDTLHTVETTRCITFLSRGPVVKNLARVISKNGEESICPFSVNQPEELLWKIVEEELLNVY